MGTLTRHLVRVTAAAAIAIVAMAAPAAANPAVSPILECVAVNGDGTFTALFGYENTSDQVITIPVGSSNFFRPGDEDRGQLTVFQPGRVAGAITATHPVGSPLNYKIGNTTVQAKSDDVACSTAPQVAEAPVVAGLLVVAGGIAVLGYRRLGATSA